MSEILSVAKLILELAVPVFGIIGYIWAIKEGQEAARQTQEVINQRLARIEKILLNGGNGLENRVTVIETRCEERHGRGPHGS